MNAFWKRSTVPRGIGLWLLCGWLIATGAISLLDYSNATVETSMDVVAIAAGVLLFMQR